MGQPPLLSVVVPTRNEAANISPLAGRLDAALAGVDAEICFVDDSDDGTPGALERLAAGSGGRVRALLRSGPERAGGLSTAVVAGIHMAQGRFVCVMDADLQHPPETIVAMLAAARQGADLVVASRYVEGGSSGGLEGLPRRVVSRGAGWVARLLFAEARQSTDPLSGFFLCRRALVDGIEFRPVGFKILLELLVCVPGLVVRDVPLGFAPRAAGESKASIRQGVLYLRHLRSLFLDVKGSARMWKFGLVGGSGLAVLLLVLAAFAVALHLPALVAFAPAFLAALAWNTSLNRIWTFADWRRRSSGEGLGRYLRAASLSGLLMFASFAALVLGPGLPVLAAGAIAAVVAMLVNGVANYPTVRRQPSVWAEVALSGGVQSALGRLADLVGADRAYVLPADHRGPGGASLPAELLARVLETRRPALVTEAASHRPQRRTNIDRRSLLILPVVRDDAVLAAVVCERVAPRGFDEPALEAATRAVDGLVAALLEARLEPAAAAAAPAPGASRSESA